MDRSPAPIRGRQAASNGRLLLRPHPKILPAHRRSVTTPISIRNCPNRRQPVPDTTHGAMAAPAHQFNDLTQQHEASTLGMWVFLATEVLFFGGMFAAYALYRYWYPDAFSSGSRQ